MATGSSSRRVVLKDVPGGATPAAVAELAKLLGVDAAMATRIVRAAPVVLADGLSAEDAATADTNLAVLRNLGANIEIQSGPPTAKMPRLNWSVPPPFLRRADSTLFTCPHCGARLAVKVLQAPSAPMPPKAAPEPEPISPEEAAKALAQTAEPQAAPPAQTAAAHAPSPSTPTQQPSQPPPPIPSPPAQEELPAEQLHQEEFQPVEAEQAPEPTGHNQPVPPSPVPQSAQAEPVAPGPASGTELEPGPFNVYTATLNISRRRAAIPLIMKYRGVSEKDAQQIAARTIVFVAEGVSANTAEQCAKEFQAAGIKVRVRKR